jgi:CrcB protein
VGICLKLLCSPLSPVPGLSFTKRNKKVGFYSFLAVGFGAVFGAWLRWWLGIILNPVFPTLPLGTLAANLLGGYLVGVAVAFFAESHLPPEARLFVITGFMGGLTTFSTFSAEVVTLFSRSEYLWGSIAAGVHLFGSLIMTTLGMATVNLLKGGVR